ncbi:MAG: haloacid dehalogenase [Candidatus Tyloplasma litorale]|nr:MAG: haloacid dehalogenase [Mycoplasmatales bacterium]
MIKPEAYFIDIDGTLLRSGTMGKINLDDKFAIKNASKKGIYIVLCTGRSLSDVRSIWKQIYDETKFTSYVIVNNGSAIWNLKTNEILFEDWISKEDFENIFKYAENKNYAIRSSDKKQFYVKPGIISFVLNKNKNISIEHDFNKIDYNNESAKKLGIICHYSKKKVSKISKDIENKFKNVDVSVSGSGIYIEVNKKGISKGSAIKFLSNKLNFNIKNSVHIGDSMNDASAFKVVGASVAMGNSMKDIKKMATYKTSSVKKSGVANAIKSFGSI